MPEHIPIRSMTMSDMVAPALGETPERASGDFESNTVAKVDKNENRLRLARQGHSLEQIAKLTAGFSLPDFVSPLVDLDGNPTREAQKQERYAIHKARVQQSLREAGLDVA